MRGTIFKYIRRVALAGGVVVAGTATAFWVTDMRAEKNIAERVATVAHLLEREDMKNRSIQPLPSRQELIKSLKETPQFDVLVIGGGASGAGTALDAQTRGLQTALVEYDDYSSGTSSRSTKLIHGGVRYLQSAILKLDLEQYRMVKEALFERASMLEAAPHLSYPLPIMLPIYKWWQVPYFWAGIKAYDLVSGRKLLKSSYYISKTKALELFPMLKKDKLVGALIYYDGQQDDSRTNLAVVMTAIRHGAKCVNHVEVTSLIKKPDPAGSGELVKGAHVRDVITGKEWDIHARVVVNATGPFTDTIRQMDNASVEKICVPSQGVHIVLPDYYSPAETGLLDPATKDGRVIFFLPWCGHTIAGTTDAPAEMTHNPSPSDREVDFILGEIQHYLSEDVRVRRGDVLSAWAGLRPLVKDPNKKNTAALARNHIIEVSDAGLVTIAGGKWTTYREMAEETVDRAIAVGGLEPKRPCVTTGIKLEGAHYWSPLLYIRLVQDFGIEVDVARHLVSAYGDRAFKIAKSAQLTGKRWPIVGKRLHPEFPYLESEIRYAVREYAMTATDVIARRLRLAFLNTYAAEECLPRIVEIMAEELNWSKQEQEEQKRQAMYFLEHEMGVLARHKAMSDTPLDLSKTEVTQAQKRFAVLDKENKGFVTVADLKRYFKDIREPVDDILLHELLNEVDLNKNGEIDMFEFLQLWSGIKKGTISRSRFAKYVDLEGEFKHSRSIASGDV